MFSHPSLNEAGICGGPSALTAHRIAASPITYRYEGTCPQSGDHLWLPRTQLAEELAQGLMAQLGNPKAMEGRMYGILLVHSPMGYQVLKAVSGRADAMGVAWVPTVPQPQQLVLSEFAVVAELEQIKRTLIQLTQLPARAVYQQEAQKFKARLAQMTACHRQRKAERKLQRAQQQAQADTLEALDNQSRRDSRERRLLKQERDQALAPLQAAIAAADSEIRDLKTRRRQLSRQLQAQMHAVYRLTNFAGERRTLAEIAPHQTMPTGTGECCAPKLLHHAATRGLRPLAMAEFWWGRPSADGSRRPGQFYGACAERCQPIMGFLLSGLPAVGTDSIPDAPFLYEDHWLVAIDKPAGLLSTPGRDILNPSNATSRLQALLEDPNLQSVHRLDQETSGILLFARSPQVHRQLSSQFRQRQVAKRYEAVVTATVAVEQGEITLPIGRYLDCRPQRRVDWAGKPSQTQFRVLARCGGQTRLELIPLTGRTHQLRVHLADAVGLGAPILGDRAYGGAPSHRLHLHGRELEFWHPQLDKRIQVITETPF